MLIDNSRQDTLNCGLVPVTGDQKQVQRFVWNNLRWLGWRMCVNCNWKYTIEQVQWHHKVTYNM